MPTKAKIQDNIGTVTVAFKDVTVKVLQDGTTTMSFEATRGTFDYPGMHDRLVNRAGLRPNQAEEVNSVIYKMTMMNALESHLVT